MPLFLLCPGLLPSSAHCALPPVTASLSLRHHLLQEVFHDPSQAQLISSSLCILDSPFRECPQHAMSLFRLVTHLCIVTPTPVSHHFGVISRVCVCTSRCQRITFGSPFSPLTMWVLGIKLRSPSLAVNPFPHVSRLSSVCL